MEGSRVPLNADRVPDTCRVLVPFAERWGLGDDYEREGLVDTATEAELVSLVSAVESVPEDDLYGWLAGPESRSQQPSEEYVAVTCLTMAAASARLRLAGG